MLVVVAAVVRREQQFGVLGGQARAQRLVVAQHRCQVLGLLAQLLHLLPQGGVLLLQVLALLGGENQDISVEVESGRRVEPVKGVCPGEPSLLSSPNAGNHIICPLKHPSCVK